MDVKYLFNLLKLRFDILIYILQHDRFLTADPSLLNDPEFRFRLEMFTS